MLYYQDNNFSLYQGDCEKVLAQIPNDSIDMVLTSPPYDNLRTYDGYVFDFEKIAYELVRVLKLGGVIVWVVADATINGSETGTSFKQALSFKELGLNLHDTMIWEKTGMLPTQDRYYNVFEYMFVLSKGKPKTMNFICDHKTTAGGRMQKKDITINKGQQKTGNGSFIRKEYSRRTNIWRIPIGRNPETNGHPAVFPEQLAQDHIITWTNQGDTVLDPFVGSGTTAKMSSLLGRKCIGIDISQNYCATTKSRYLKTKDLFN